MEKQELAKQGTGALAKAADVAPWRMDGETSEDFIIPRLTIHQGDISEKKYGAGEKGSIIYTTSSQKVDDPSFVPICGWKEYICWGAEQGDPMLYRTRNRDEVPAGDLDWTKNGEKDVPPKCETFSNIAVILKGKFLPVILSLSKSSKHQYKFGRVLNQLEKERGAEGKPRGLYKIEVIDEQNAKGKWKDMLLRPAGDAPADMMELVAEWSTKINPATAKTNIGDNAPDATPSEGFDPESFK